MKHPPFATIIEGNFRAMRSGDQIDLVDEATTFLPEIGPGYGKNPSARWQQIRRAKAAYWESKKDRPAATIKAGAITATEANEVLAAMPPVPLWGEQE